MIKCCFFHVPFFVQLFAALNISEVINFQEGFFEATLLKISATEATGDIRGAFLLAVSLKALDFKVNNSHDVYANSTVLTWHAQAMEVTIKLLFIF